MTRMQIFFSDQTIVSQCCSTYSTHMVRHSDSSVGLYWRAAKKFETKSVQNCQSGGQQEIKAGWLTVSDGWVIGHPYSNLLTSL